MPSYSAYLAEDEAWQCAHLVKAIALLMKEVAESYGNTPDLLF